MHSRSSQLPGVCIVVPTLNEEQNIDPLLRAIFDACRDQLDAQVIVVDDNSQDQTQAHVRAWEADHSVRLLAREPHGGLAGAVVAGAELAEHDVVVVMDADLSHPPQRLADLALPVIRNECDMVVGSRYVPGGSTPDWPLKRWITSRAAAMLAWPLVDVHDPMSGFFAVRRERLIDAGKDAEGFKIGLEILAAGGDDLRVREVPIEFHDRQFGQSKLNAGQIFSYLRRLKSMAGGAVTAGSALRFGIVGLLGFGLDLACFSAFTHWGLTLGPAHLLSFLLATVFNFVFNARWAFRGFAQASGDPHWQMYVRFLVVALMAMFLRGGVLAAMVNSMGVPPSAAIVAAVGLASLVNYIGAAFFVFPTYSRFMTAAMRWRMAALSVVGYLVLLRLVYLGLPDLLVEEAYYWNYAQHPALSYLDHPPMVAWLIAAGTWLFGDTEFGVRIGAVFCWLVAAVFSYLLTRDLFGKSAAMRVVLLLSVLPVFFIFGFYMTPDAPLIACWAGALFFLQRALLQQRRLAWWGVGVCLGLGMLSKYTIALLGPAAIAFVLIDPRARHWLRRPEPYAAILLTVALFSPVVLWNAGNGWTSFAFQSTARLHHPTHFSLHLLLLSAAGLLTPIGLIAAGKSLLPRRWGGVVMDRIRQALPSGRVRLFVVVLTLVPLSVFVWFSLKHPPKMNWTGPIWLVVLPLLALDLVPRVAAASRASEFGRRLWAPAVVVATLFYAGMLHYLTLGLPGVPYPRDAKLVGWRELGRQIEDIENDLEHRIGSDPLVVGMDKYNIASELAFYRPGHTDPEPLDDLRAGMRESVQETTSRHLFGDSGLMYEWWAMPDRQRGRSVIMVADDQTQLSNRRLLAYFDQLEPICSLDLNRNGKSAGAYYYRIGHGYHTVQ